MEKKMTFNYFYGTEADQFSFYRIPKALFTDSYFKDLSSDAKILYGLMLDRMSLSIKNQWFDDKNRAYIYFSIEDIMELLNCGRNKAIKSMRELDDETGIGLIEKRRQGFGKVNVIYVKTFMPEKTDEKKFGEELEKFKKQTSVENEETAEVYNLNFMKSQNQTSRSPENKLQEVYISNPNNTNLSDTEMNDNKSNHIISVDEKRCDSDNRSEDYQAYENLVKETIDYESLEVGNKILYLFPINNLNVQNILGILYSKDAFFFHSFFINIGFIFIFQLLIRVGMQLYCFIYIKHWKF